MPHIVLLGDSIFDNAAYVGSGPDVITQLRAELPPDWQATLKAVDGSTTEDIPAQLAQLPTTATHLVLSVGGNNALMAGGFLEEPAQSVGEVMRNLARIREQFQEEYRQMMEGVLKLNLPTAACTIYDPCFSEPYQSAVATALTVLNDCITRTVFKAGLPLIDLRLVCNEQTDYANPIEPSSAGGAKIARTIAQLLRNGNFARGRTEVYSG